MRLNNLIFFYIYLKEITYSIKSGKFHTRMTTEETVHGEQRNKGWLLALTLKAMATCILVFFIMVYLHQGSIIFNADGSSIFNTITLFELSASFVFFFLVFISHRAISSLMAQRALTNLPSIPRGTIEAVLVVISSVVLLLLTLLIPFYLVFPEVEVGEGRIRFNFIFMAILTLFFYYFVERERSKKQLQAEMLRSARLQKENFEAQLQNLKNQVNPHFLFNSLNVLGSIIQKDQDQAVEFVRKLSEVYRSFLSNSGKELIALEEEFEIVDAYNYLLKTRFGDAIEFIIDIAPKKLSLLLPPGSLQTLVENVIKHNGSTRKDPLVIRIYTQGGELVVSNQLRPRKDDTGSTRTGLQNIANRYKYLSDRIPQFSKTETEFIAKLPLLNPEEDESSNH